MSFITDVVVVTMYDEDDAIAEVNRHLTAGGDDQVLRLLDMESAGGRKAITAQVWAASFNYLNEAKLRAALLAAPWRIPGEVTFCVSGENWSERFWPGPLPAVLVTEPRRDDLPVTIREAGHHRRLACEMLASEAAPDGGGASQP